MLAFISHTHADERLARAVIDMIEGRYHIGRDEIRCTSVPGYALELGDAPETVLRSELAEVRFVIGIVTACSLSSAWVQAELGATWGLDAKLALMLFPGVGDDHVPSLFRNLVSVDLRAAGRGPHEFAPSNAIVGSLRNLLDQVGAATSWSPKQGTSNDDLAETFVQDVCSYDPRLRAPDLLVTRGGMIEERAYGLRWAQIAAYATREIRIWGWSCMNAINGNSRNIFQKWLNESSDRTLRVLVMNPDDVESSELEFGPVCGITQEGVIADIRAAIDRWVRWRDSALGAAAQVEILATNWNLTFSGVAVDLESDWEDCDGIIQTEYYSYNAGVDHLDNRPNLIVRRGSRFWAPQHKSVMEIFRSGVPV